MDSISHTRVGNLLQGYDLPQCFLLHIIINAWTRRYFFIYGSVPNTVLAKRLAFSRSAVMSLPTLS